MSLQGARPTKRGYLRPPERTFPWTQSDAFRGHRALASLFLACDERDEIVSKTMAPRYFSPLQGLQRLETLMDECAGGYSTYYMASEPLLNRALKLLSLLKEDMAHPGTEKLYQLQRASELNHWVWTAESVVRHTLFSVVRHTLFREETRWPDYPYRADHPKLDDDRWHVFTASEY